MAVKHLCIGHCCHDLVDNSYILGGSASYSSVLSRSWGLDTSLLTSVGEDFLFQNRFENLGIDFQNVPADQTTVFYNQNIDNTRTQFLKSRANTITANAFPSNGREFDIVQFCPIADEIDFELFAAFPQSLKVASIQGFLRQWDENGLVSLKEMEWQWLSHMDIIILSTEDIAGAPEYLNHITEYCDHVILTDNENGATVYYKNEIHHYPAILTQLIDSTGAGDTFATAYAIDYYQNEDITSACSFAHSAASCIIEIIGLSHIPQLSEIQTRQNKYLANMNVNTTRNKHEN